MSNLLGGALFPHGTMTLDPSKEGLPKGAEALHEACVEAGKRIRETKPDLIILCTPHGLSLSSSLGIYLAPSANGSAEWNEEWKEFQVELKINVPLASSLLDFLRNHNAPADGITFFSGLSAPLRWGEVVPTHFIVNEGRGKSESEKPTDPEFVIITPPRGLGKSPEEARANRISMYPELVRMGNLIREWTNSIDRRVWFVVSGDLSHLHAYDTSVSDIYKPAPSWTDWEANEKAAEFDREMEDWVSTLSESELIKTMGPKDIVARSCGYSGCLILQGALKGAAEWKPSVLANVHPTYFGMMVALWQRE